MLTKNGPLRSDKTVSRLLCRRLSPKTEQTNLFFHRFFFVGFLGESKGQSISKCLLGVFNFLQKTNENKSHSSKVEFVRSFFGGNVGLRKSFRLCLTFTARHGAPISLRFYLTFRHSNSLQGGSIEV